MDMRKREPEKINHNASVTHQLVNGGGKGRKGYYYSPGKPFFEPPSPSISRSLFFLCLSSENALDPLMNLFLDYIEEGKEGGEKPSSGCEP